MMVERRNRKKWAWVVGLGLILWANAASAGGPGGPSDEYMEQRAEISLVVSAGEDDHQAGYLLLDSDPEPTWFEDDPKFVGYRDAVASIAGESVPESYRQWERGAVDVVDEDGTRCRADVDELVGLSRATTTPMERQKWKGNTPPGSKLSGTGLRREAVAANLWERGEPALAARLVRLEGDCDDARLRWGHRSDRQTKAMDSTELMEHEKVRLRRAFHQRSEYRSVQRQFERFSGDDANKTWSQHESTTVEIDAFQSAKTDRIFAVVRADAGPGCGEFGASSWELFELSYQSGRLQVTAMEVVGSLPLEVTLVDTADTDRPVLVTTIHPLGGYPGTALVIGDHDRYRTGFLSTSVAGYSPCGC